MSGEMSAEARSTFESRTVWMLGSPRSGSTWLLSLLAQHPLVVPMNEPTLGYHLSPFLMNEPGYRRERPGVQELRAAEGGRTRPGQVLLGRL